MGKKTKCVEVSEGCDLVSLAEEVRASREPILLMKNGEQLALLTPVPRRAKAFHKGRPLTEDDPLFGLIGIGRSGIPGGLSESKHEYHARVRRKR